MSPSFITQCSVRSADTDAVGSCLIAMRSARFPTSTEPSSPSAPSHAATLGPAAWLGIDDDVGSVDVGKRADLIAMRQDPTASVSALRTLHWVMKDGDVYRDDAWVR